MVDAQKKKTPWIQIPYILSLFFKCEDNKDNLKFRARRISKGYAHFMEQLVLCKQMTNESIFSVKENDLQLEKDNIMVFEGNWTLYVTFLPSSG